MTVQKLTFSQTAKLKPNEYYVKGYRFVGWSEDKNAYSAQFKDGAAFDFGAAGYKSKVRLYAVWIAEQQ